MRRRQLWHSHLLRKPLVSYKPSTGQVWLGLVFIRNMTIITIVGQVDFGTEAINSMKIHNFPQSSLFTVKPDRMVKSVQSLLVTLMPGSSPWIIMQWLLGEASIKKLGFFRKTPKSRDPPAPFQQFGGPSFFSDKEISDFFCRKGGGGLPIPKFLYQKKTGASKLLEGGGGVSGFRSFSEKKKTVFFIDASPK